MPQSYAIVPALHDPRPQIQRLSMDDRRTLNASVLLSRLRHCIQGIGHSWQHYFRHSAFVPSFALAILYLTVLSFSGQMVTYLVSAGFNSFHVGLVRSMSVIVELSATWIAPRVISRIGPYRSGIWFLSWQATWLVAIIIFFWNQPPLIVAASGLAAGTVMSRVGLWGYDLSASLIIQLVSSVYPKY